MQPSEDNTPAESNEDFQQAAQRGLESEFASAHFKDRPGKADQNLPLIGPLSANDHLAMVHCALLLLDSHQPLDSAASGKVMEYLNQACESENPIVLEKIAGIYADGIFSPDRKFRIFAADLDKSIRLLERAVGLGSATAMCDLANILLMDRFINTHLQRALTLYITAAKRGSGRAHERLGYIYSGNQTIVPPNLELATSHYQKAAELGDSDAQYNIGTFYALGNELPQDFEAAHFWWQHSAQQGNQAAQFALGIMHGKGDGVPVDEDLSSFWYHLAGDQGHADAIESLTRLGWSSPALAIYDAGDWICLKGAWADRDISGALCYGIGSSWPGKTLLERCVAAGGLVGIPADHSNIARWAMLGFCNGIVAALKPDTRSRLRGLLPVSPVDSKQLANQLSQHPALRDTDAQPFIRYRTASAELLGSLTWQDQIPDAETAFLAFAHAGCEAIESDNLMAASLGFTVDEPGFNQNFLSSLLATECAGLLPQEQMHPLVRFVGATYDRQSTERSAVTSALQKSIARLGGQEWDVRDFLCDAAAQVEALLADDPALLPALLAEIKNPQKMMDLMTRFVGVTWTLCGSQQMWDGLRRWLIVVWPTTITSNRPEMGFMVLRHAYDFIFWFRLMQLHSAQTNSLHPMAHTL